MSICNECVTVCNMKSKPRELGWCSGFKGKLTDVTGVVEWTVDGHYTRFGTQKTLVEVSKSPSKEDAISESEKIATKLGWKIEWED